MHRFSVFCAASAAAIILLSIAEARADFAYATATAGEVETVYDSDGPAASVSAQHDSAPGLGYMGHAQSSASINADSEGRPTFHMRLLTEYSAPQFSDLSSSFARLELQFSDTITFTGDDVGSQIFGYAQATIEGLVTATGIGSRGTLDLVDENGNTVRTIDSRFDSGPILQDWDVPITLNGSNGVYTGTLNLTLRGFAIVNETGKLDLDFSNTFNFTGITYFDSSFNPLIGTTTSGLGYRYNGATAVPLPGALALLVSGAPCLAGYFLVLARSRRSV